MKLINSIIISKIKIKLQYQTVKKVDKMKTENADKHF